MTSNGYYLSVKTYYLLNTILFDSQIFIQTNYYSYIW